MAAAGSRRARPRRRTRIRATPQSGDGARSLIAARRPVADGPGMQRRSSPSAPSRVASPPSASAIEGRAALAPPTSVRGCGDPATSRAISYSRRGPAPNPRHDAPPAQPPIGFSIGSPVRCRATPGIDAVATRRADTLGQTVRLSVERPHLCHAEGDGEACVPATSGGPPTRARPPSGDRGAPSHRVALHGFPLPPAARRQRLNARAGHGRGP